MIQLSQTSARQMLPGEELRCHVVKGLSLRRKMSGAAWFLEYRSPIDGRRRRPKLGTFPALTVENAREAARQVLRRIAAGEDPSAEKQERRHAPTIADLHVWFMDNHARPRKAPRSAYLDDYYFNRFLAKRVGSLRVRDVTAAEITRALDEVAKETSGVMANRCRSLLSAMFGFAESDALNWRPKRSNPVTGRDVPRRPEFPRRRYLSSDEFARLGPAMVAVSKDQPRHVTAIACILYAGSRVTELASAKWQHVEGSAIVRREHKTAKTGAVRTIRLPAQAWAMIERLPQHPGGWIFGPDINVVSLNRCWQKVRRLAGFPDVQIRDLRRTFASLIRSRGGTLADAGDLLGHSSPTITAKHYAFLFADAATERVQSAADAADVLLTGLGEAGKALEHKGG